MPDVEGEVLQDAWDKVVSTTDGAVVPETATAEGPPFEQFNLTNWEVCSQSPDEGTRSRRSRRPNSRSCGRVAAERQRTHE